MHLLVATTNPNKLREISGILAGLDVDLIGLGAFPAVAEPAETGRSFGENARAKAVYYSTMLGVAAVARAFELIRDPQRPWPQPPSEALHHVD